MIKERQSRLEGGIVCAPTAEECEFYISATFEFGIIF